MTQTTQIKLALPDSEQLEAGLSGQVDFIIASEKQHLVKSSALVKRVDVFGVYRVEHGLALFTPVNFERQWQHYQVILSGLSAGDQVISHPPPDLKDRSPIRPIQENESNEQYVFQYRSFLGSYFYRAQTGICTCASRSSIWNDGFARNTPGSPPDHNSKRSKENAVPLANNILWLFLGWRAAAIVLLTIPIVFALVIGVDLLAGPTLNRITLYALILALGMLVDDAIVVIKNIHRHNQLLPESSSKATYSSAIVSARQSTLK